MTHPVLPETIDLDALHAAYLAEGYTSVEETTHYRTYSKKLRGFSSPSFASIPISFEVPYGARHAKDMAHRALDWLVAETGNPHFEVGPRNDRERAMLAAINLLRTGTVGQVCSCGNQFGADNLCMPSACQDET